MIIKKALRAPLDQVGGYVTSLLGILMLAICFFMAGCFGAMSYYPVECDFDYPLTDYTYTKKEFGPCDGAEVIYFSKDDFLQWWGKPDEAITISENKEVWLYNKSDDYCGVVPAFGIAVPILARACEVYDEITFENDLAVHVHFKRIVEAGFVMPLGYRGSKECPNDKNNLKHKNENTIPTNDHQPKD